MWRVFFTMLICWRCTEATLWMDVDGRANVRSIVLTITRPSTGLPQVCLETGPPGHGHVRSPVSTAATTMNYSDPEDSSAGRRDSRGAPEPLGVGHPEAGKTMTVKHGPSRAWTSAASYAHECLVSGRRGS